MTNSLIGFTAFNLMVIHLSRDGVCGINSIESYLYDGMGIGASHQVATSPRSFEAFEIAECLDRSGHESSGMKPPLPSPVKTLIGSSKRNAG